VPRNDANFGIGTLGWNWLKPRTTVDVSPAA
jgi:hypothetical protein